MKRERLALAGVQLLTSYIFFSLCAMRGYGVLEPLPRHALARYKFFFLFASVTGKFCQVLILKKPNAIVIIIHLNRSFWRIDEL